MLQARQHRNDLAKDNDSNRVAAPAGRAQTALESITEIARKQCHVVTPLLGCPYACHARENLGIRSVTVLLAQGARGLDIK